nr:MULTISPECIES: hypothetical protein [Burkholderia cepacia complex]
MDELGTLIRWLTNFSLTVADALTLYLWTGTRGGEIVAMESTEVAEEADGPRVDCPETQDQGAPKRESNGSARAAYMY